MRRLSLDLDDYLAFNNKTYTEFSKEVGVAPSTISHWINKGGELSAYTFSKVAYCMCKEDKFKQEQYFVEYIDSLENRSNINIKVAFAIAHLNDHPQLMNSIYCKCEESDDLELNRLAKIFKLRVLQNGSGAKIVSL